jgi:hypothetical protein
MATTAYKAVTRAVAIGQEAEHTFKQMGKWYTAVADIRKAAEHNKNPPIFKKLFSAGSVEEESLQLLIHEKKIMEQERELRSLLNFRFGPNTWTELTEMRRKIRAQREKEVYKQKELQRSILDGIAIGLLVLLVGGSIWGMILLAISQGKF